MTSSPATPRQPPSGPFTTKALESNGLGAGVIRRSDISRVTRGVHVVGVVDDAVRRAGLMLVLPADASFSCQTAAEIWSLPTGPDESSIVHVRTTSQVRRSGVIAHLGPVGEINRRAGFRVTSPIATFFDLAVHLDDRWLLAVGDAIVRRGYAAQSALLLAVDQSPRRPGLARVRRVSPHVRPDVDSPMESLLRHLLITAGLPEPSINANVHDSHGGWIARPDLSYPDRRIAIEYDGRHHFDDRRQWENDIARRHNLEDEGWVVRIATARDVFVQAARFGADMLALWRRRG